jgi:hypothetical protein
MMLAGRQPDICGLFVEPVDLAWTGGYYLLHREVALYGADNEPDSPAFYNFAIRDADDPGPGVGIATNGSAILMRTGDSCDPDPNFTYALDQPPE